MITYFIFYEIKNLLTNFSELLRNPIKIDL